MSDIPVVIWNFRAVPVLPPHSATAHLTAQEEDEPDQERTCHHQRRSQRGKVSEHTDPFPLSAAQDATHH